MKHKIKNDDFNYIIEYVIALQSNRKRLILRFYANNPAMYKYVLNINNEDVKYFTEIDKAIEYYNKI